MKYLYIHKIIWAILVIGWTLVESIIIYTFVLLYVLWNFKLPENVWSICHTYSDYVVDTSSSPSKIDEKIHSDVTILATIKRRYKII